MAHFDKDKADARIARIKALGPAAVKEKLAELHHAKGYATAHADLIKMIEHLKGEKMEDLGPDATITMDELADLMRIGMNSLPLYQEFKEDTGVED